MCDLSEIRKIPCYGTVGNWLEPVKISKWELPTPSSKSYWDEVCTEIEKKHERVSNLDHLLLPSFTIPARTRHSDDIKFKISPPTPMRETQKSTEKTLDNNLFTISDRQNKSDENLKLPPATPKKAKPPSKRETLKEIKIYPKKSCPLHKNARPPKIFDDDISKYLNVNSSVPKLPSVETAPRCKSASSIASIKIKPADQRKIAKAPKLGMASLLPSFAKAVSIDSSTGTPDSEEDLSKAQQPKRDYLRVPNLCFISSHPSFRKLSLADSYDEDDAKEKESSVDEQSTKAERKMLSFKEELKMKRKKVQLPKKEKSDIIDFEKKYAYKALDLITKNKQSKIKTKIDDLTSVPYDDQSVDRSEKVIPKKSKLLKRDESSIDFKEIHRKLKESHLGTIASPELEETEPVTIYSSSRSTSGLSLDFKVKSIVAPSSDILQEIPSTKVFQRAYIDKCHACLYNPFKAPPKINRELPLTTLKSIIDNGPTFAISSSSSGSSLEELRTRLSQDSDDDIPEFDDRDASADVENKSKVEQFRVSFDSSTVLPDPKSAEAGDRGPQSLHHLREKSLSIQSSDRSKTSTPSRQSSDSDEAHLMEDKMPSSKYMAPCHAPVIWHKNFEPLRAMKARKYMTLKQRAAAICAKSSDGSESDSEEAATKQEINKQEETEKPAKDTKKVKKKKPLVRVSTSLDVLKAKDVKSRKLLKRAKTTFDLTAISDESESEESTEEEVGSEMDKVEKEPDQLPLSEVIKMHVAGSPPPPIMPPEDLIEIIKASLEIGFDPNRIMEDLSDEFVKRIEDRCKKLTNSEDRKYLELGLNLFKASIDSRRYLKPDIFDPNLEFSNKQPPLTNSRQLRNVLPLKSYELVAPILGMPQSDSKPEKKVITVAKEDTATTVSESGLSELSFDMIVHPPTPKRSAYKGSGFNPYASFLKKPRRKAVTWRPLREEDLRGYDPEATLEMRAARLMHKISTEFCDWLKNLGGTDQVIDEEMLKDMFEINFTAEACKAMQVVIKEMPTVPDEIVKIRNCPEANELIATRKQILKDLKVEKRPKRTFAFGRNLPYGLRFVPPKSRLSGRWLECKNIPQDLQTMDVVWNGIMDLDSVKSFINHLKDTPKDATKLLLKNLIKRKQTEKMRKRDNTIDGNSVQVEKFVVKVEKDRWSTDSESTR